MDAEAFSELPFRNKQNWDALPHPRGIRIPVDMDGFDASPVMAALDGVPREPAQDAYAYFDGTGFDSGRRSRYDAQKGRDRGSTL